MSRSIVTTLAVASFLTPAFVGGQASRPPAIESWPLCELIGPGAQRPGVYGTDLGFTFRHPYRAADGSVDERIVFLFGDTWPTFDSPCTEPPWTNDDTVATLRLADLPAYPPGPPATGVDAPRCPVLDFAVPDPLHDRPLRVLHQGRDLNMSYNRTPVAGWSDGRRPYGLFTAAEVAMCTTAADCSAGQQCIHGELGRCTVDPCPAGESCGRDPRIDEVLSAPVCRFVDGKDNNDCAAPFSPRRRCALDPEGRGLCADPTSSMVITQQAFAPNDPDRRLLATQWSYVATEDPARPNVWLALARVSTGKFINPAARTVAAFDPDDPSKNDYRPGYDTLLVWGKPWFSGAAGAQALTYLLYNELTPQTSDAPMRWAPRYFAGYGDDGRPRWSDREADAAPLYPSEFDVVNQISLSFVPPLGVWVMLYGGDETDGSGGSPPRTYPSPAPGGLHLRYAKHPWGAATRSGAGDANSGAWSEPFVVLRPEDAPQLLACRGKNDPPGCDAGDKVRPIDFFRARMTGADCRLPPPPGTSMGQGNPGYDRGIFYSSIIIDELTRAVEPKQKGARAAELVWEISPWNPYAVWLIKSRIEIAAD